MRANGSSALCCSKQRIRLQKAEIVDAFCSSTHQNQQQKAESRIILNVV
ncbi:hypothetical protein HMPREF1580_00782 [Gardnerella vaginalis JCP8070]|nr:hypothetical protein HMPREF1580_00782 [Gardnerella vaginalis JCP8070]